MPYCPAILPAVIEGLQHILHFLQAEHLTGAEPGRFQHLIGRPLPPADSQSGCFRLHGAAFQDLEKSELEFMWPQGNDLAERPAETLIILERQSCDQIQMQTYISGLPKPRCRVPDLLSARIALY